MGLGAALIMVPLWVPIRASPGLFFYGFGGFREFRV